MFSNRLAFATLGFACVVAAAGGSYVATRHNAVDQFAAPASAAVAVTTPAATLDTPTTAAAAPVTTTEAVPAARPVEPVPAIARSTG